MERIRVLHVIKSLGRGGAESLLPRTLRYHDRESFQFHYVYFLPWKDQMVEELREAGAFMVTCLNANHTLKMLWRARRLEEYVIQNRIQIIHAHLPWAGFVARLVGKRTKVPVIYTEHNKQERYHWVTRSVNRLTFRHQHQVIAVSEAVRDSIKRWGDMGVPVRRVYNGLDSDHFVRSLGSRNEARLHLGIPSDAPVVGSVSVFRKQKRMIEWLELFSQMASDEPRLFGILVGDGPEKEAIVQRRKELGLEERIRMPGLQQDVRPWLAAMDVFMVTSRYEGLPVALLEAMSMELPVVSTNAGGIVEAVEQGVTGYLEPVEDYLKLGKWVTLLLQDREQRARMGAAARHRVSEHFDIRHMVKQLEHTYRHYIVQD